MTLLQSLAYEYATNPAVVTWPVLGLLLGVIAGTIFEQKGHRAQMWTWFLLSLFCPLLGLIGLARAINAPDLVAEERAQEFSDRLALQSDELRSETFQRAKLSEAGAVPGQVRCPRCGSMNASELVECWHCHLELTHEEGLGDVILESPPSKLATELRVACRKCDTIVTGSKHDVQTMHICPNCGAIPFDYRQLPKA